MAAPTAVFRLAR